MFVAPVSVMRHQQVKTDRSYAFSLLPTAPFSCQGLCVFGEGKAEEGKGRFGMATVVA